MSKISILIPCYNAEKYLSRCLDSVLNIKFNKSDYYIICYDDGSTDRTLNILNTYKKHHLNITIIKNKKNNGVWYARQRLMNAVKTKYFYFIDADDYVNITGLLETYNLAQNTEADLTISKSYIYTVNQRVRINWLATRFSSNTSLKKYVNNNLFYLWNILIKTSFFKQTNFTCTKKSSFGEDHVLLSILFSFNPKLAFNKQYTYYYSQHSQSMMKKSDQIFKRMQDNFNNFVEICKNTQINRIKFPELYKAIMSNALYIVLMNIGMVFSRTIRGRNLRKNLNFEQKEKCKTFLLEIKKNIQRYTLQVQLPSSWWKKISAFIYIHHILKKMRK